jgi:CBS-domain-containing membrane protein
MKALVYRGPGQKAWEDVPKLEISADADAIVRVDATTIRGTDLLMRHASSEPQHPMTTHASGGVAVHRADSGHESDAGAVTAVRPRRLVVEDVMTRDVVTVAPTATFHQMIGLMRLHGISALPVVGEQGALLGVVSEADLLLKESPPSPWRRWLPEGSRSATRRRKADGVDAADVMTTPVVSVGSRASLVVAVRLLQQHQIKRLVVLDAAHKMVGIVSRRDLLAGFSRSDAEIRADVIEGLIPRCLLVDPTRVRVEVHGGVVRLEGTADRRSDVEVLAHRVRRLDGVVDVDSAVEYGWDDRDLAPSRELHIT